jgi:hypothetical protein
MSIIAGIIGSTVSTAAPPSPNTSLEVRQWINGYSTGGNSSFIVLLADYPTAADIPVGASAIVSNAGTPTAVIVTDNAAITYYGQAVRQLSLDVSGLTIPAGNDATFSWYQAP